MGSQSESKTQCKQDYWKEQIQNWKISGLSQKQYCLDHSLALSTFCYWKRRLNKPAEVQRNTTTPLDLLRDIVRL